MTDGPVPDPSIPAGQQQLVDDVVLLLDDLSRVPGSRLDWCFEDMRSSVTGVPANVAVPPERKKEDFVSRVMDAAFRVRQPVADGGAAPLNAIDVAFLIRARDFLSVVAQPASVESTRVTHAYCEERARRHGPRAWLRDGRGLRQ